MIKPILYYPNPVLITVCDFVMDFDDSLKQLVTNLIDTMKQAHGLGLAAPQIGVNKRVIVVASPDPDKQIVMVNPFIIERAGEFRQAESCLSIPGLSVQVIRSTDIRVSYCDENGEPVEGPLTGQVARAIQHEIDHLNGVLILDYLSPLQRKLELEKRAKRARKFKRVQNRIPTVPKHRPGYLRVN